MSIQQTVFLLLIVIPGVSSTCNAQASIRPEFDVAYVKPAAPRRAGDLSAANPAIARNGTVALTNATLSDCIKFAYGIFSDSQISGPDWIKSDDVRFDILGKTHPNTDRDDLLLMLQDLLADRLNLVLHNEQRLVPFYALVAGPQGLRIVQYRADQSAAVKPINTRGRIVNHRMSMSGLAFLLSRFEHVTVKDMTGLDGTFDVNLEWDPDNTTGPSLSTAIREQLGLTLESRKGPMEVWIVDQAEKVPVEN